VAVLEANSDLQGQFERAIVEKDLEMACCLRGLWLCMLLVSLG